MREDRDNLLALPSRRWCQEQTDYEQELKRLQADLEAERIQTLRARGQLGAELRCLREEAEQDCKRAVRELAARRGYHKDRDGHRCLLAKEGKFKEVESAGESFLSCRGKTKLERLLLTLFEEINGEQATRKLHHRQEFELEKAIFLCRLLGAHGRLLPGVEPPNSKPQTLSKKPTWDNRINLCQTTPLAACSRAPLRSSSDPPSPKQKSKQDQEKQPSGGGLLTAALCTAAAVECTRQVRPQQICPPQRTPYAGRDNQLSSWTKSSGSDESSSGTAGTMEVSSVTFLGKSFFFLACVSFKTTDPDTGCRHFYCLEIEALTLRLFSLRFRKH